MLKDDDLDKVAGCVVEQTSCSNQIEPKYCLSCGSYCDLEASLATAYKAGIRIKRYSYLISLEFFFYFSIFQENMAYIYIYIYII